MIVCVIVVNVASALTKRRSLNGDTPAAGGALCTQRPGTISGLTASVVTARAAADNFPDAMVIGRWSGRLYDQGLRIVKVSFPALLKPADLAGVSGRQPAAAAGEVAGHGRGAGRRVVSRSCPLGSWTGGLVCC